MAYRRKYVKRRFKRKARTVRRTMRRAMPRSIYGQGKIYSFRRTCECYPYHYKDGSWVKLTANYISSNAATLDYVNGIFKFSLQDLPNYTDFTNLYENFRITGVRLRFMPIAGTESGSYSATSSIMEPLAFCIDRGANDAIGINPGFTQLLENQDCKIRSSYKPFSIYIAYPKAHAPADGVTQTVLMSPWLDTEVNGQVVDHHGLKFCFQTATPADRSVAYRVYATYYIKCRAPQ